MKSNFNHDSSLHTQRSRSMRSPVRSPSSFSTRAYYSANKSRDSISTNRGFYSSTVQKRSRRFPVFFDLKCNFSQKKDKLDAHLEPIRKPTSAAAPPFNSPLEGDQEGRKIYRWFPDRYLAEGFHPMPVSPRGFLKMHLRDENPVHQNSCLPFNARSMVMRSVYLRSPPMGIP